MQKDQTNHKEKSGMIENQNRASSTMRMENHSMPMSSLKRSFSFSDKLITGIIAIALMCLAPIIPILIAFGVGHFARYNADKLKQEKEYERNHTRRH